MQVKPMHVCKLGPNGKPDDACDIKVHGAKVMNGLLFVLFYCYCCLSFWQHVRTHWHHSKSQTTAVWDYVIKMLCRLPTSPIHLFWRCDCSWVLLADYGNGRCVLKCEAANYWRSGSKTERVCLTSFSETAILAGLCLVWVLLYRSPFIRSFIYIKQGKSCNHCNARSVSLQRGVATPLYWPPHLCVSKIQF